MPREPETAIVRGGGFEFITSDPVLIAVMHRLAQFEAENVSLRYELVARYRTLRRDVTQIKRKVCGAR